MAWKGGGDLRCHFGSAKILKVCSLFSAKMHANCSLISHTPQPLAGCQHPSSSRKVLARRICCAGWRHRDRGGHFSAKVHLALPDGFPIKVVLGALHLPSDTARIAPVTSASERTLTSLLVNRL